MSPVGTTSDTPPLCDPPVSAVAVEMMLLWIEMLSRGVGSTVERLIQCTRPVALMLAEVNVASSLCHTLTC